MSRSGIRWDRRLEAAVVLVAGIAFGAWREFAFINLNYQIDHLARHTRFSYAHSLVQGWTNGWDLATLLRVKWGLALFSMLVVALLCILLARTLYGSWRHRNMILAGFAAFAKAEMIIGQPVFAAIWLRYFSQSPGWRKKSRWTSSTLVRPPSSGENRTSRRLEVASLSSGVRSGEICQAMTMWWGRSKDSTLPQTRSPPLLSRS